MTARETAKQREPAERVHPGPEPRLRLLKLSAECSTPELASELSEGVKAALRRLGRKRKAGAGDDPPEAA